MSSIPMMNDSLSSDRNRAEALIRMGRGGEAIPIYRRLAEQFPEEESLLLSMAWALHDSGRVEEAIDCFERLFRKELARRLFTGFAYDELVRIYREGKNWEGLISVCKRAAEAQPEDPGLLRTLGEAYLAAGLTDGALQIFEKLAALEPDAPENWCTLGNARLAAGNTGEAEEAYAKAANLDHAEAPLFYSRLAAGFLRAGHPQRAQAAAERCLALNPTEPLYWMELGDVLVHLEKPDAAVDAYSRAVSLRPTDSGDFWHRLGNLLMREGLLPQASEAFAKAVAADPGNPRHHLRLAESYAARGLDDLAAAALCRAEARIHPEST